ncbi:MAG: hypothetical protein E6J90_12765 [Deltaproteobacteria bacterium]|nr:MAG: hypothetical protein E6J90_12765 [Deltaproteobacteria bacterium]
MTEPAISTPIVAVARRPPSRRWTRWLARCAMMLGGLALGGGVAEAMFYYRDGGAFPHLNVYVADPELGVRLSPGATETVAFGGNPATHVRISRDGFRGVELPAPGGDDVLVVGDSQVFGLGVEEDETFSARLARAIGRPVVNAGVPTYGPAEYRAVIAEQLARRHPRTVVLTVNLANDLFEAGHPNKERHAVWDGWAVRRETAPGDIIDFPGRELLYRRSHLFFALRKWRHGGGSSEAMEGGVASEGTWRDIVRSGEQVQHDRVALDQARRARLDAVTQTHQAIEAAETEIDRDIRRLLRGEDVDDLTLAIARANPGDIVGNPFAESTRSARATADHITEAAAVRARLRDQLARWARAHQAEAKGVLAQLAVSDQAVARLTELDVQKLQAALDPPLASYLRDVQQLVEHGGARLVVLILPLDVQVSPAEWRKYGASPIDMGPSLALASELAALCRSLGVSVLDATPVLAAAEPGAFLDKDIHMTPKGHAAVAAALAATLGETPPARAAVSLRSPIPLPDVFKRASEVIVTGSSSAGCETKQVREWLRVRCAPTELSSPLGAEITRDDGHEAMVLVMPSELSLLIPVVEGREVTATVRWTDVTRVLHVAWQVGAAHATLAFDKPVARTRPPGPDELGYRFRSPVERAICDCWRQVFEGRGRRDEPVTCRGAYGAPDPACVSRYYHSPATCPQLLACIRRDPASPP